MADARYSFVLTYDAPPTFGAWIKETLEAHSSSVKAAPFNATMPSVCLLQLDTTQSKVFEQGTSLPGLRFEIYQLTQQYKAQLDSPAHVTRTTTLGEKNDTFAVALTANDGISLLQQGLKSMLTNEFRVQFDSSSPPFQPAIPIGFIKNKKTRKMHLSAPEDLNLSLNKLSIFRHVKNSTHGRTESKEVYEVPIAPKKEEQSTKMALSLSTLRPSLEHKATDESVSYAVILICEPSAAIKGWIRDTLANDASYRPAFAINQDELHITLLRFGDSKDLRKIEQDPALRGMLEEKANKKPADLCRMMGINTENLLKPIYVSDITRMGYNNEYICLKLRSDANPVQHYQPVLKEWFECEYSISHQSQFPFSLHASIGCIPKEGAQKADDIVQRLRLSLLDTVTAKKNDILQLRLTPTRCVISHRVGTGRKATIVETIRLFPPRSKNEKSSGTTATEEASDQFSHAGLSYT